MILARHRHRPRPAVSEVIGSLVMIAITLVAGTAVFGFVYGQAGTSAKAVGNSAASNINFLNERISFVTEQMSASGASIWVYNNGRVDYTLSSLEVKSVTGTDPLKFIDVIFFQTPPCPAGQNCGYVEYDRNGLVIPACSSSSGSGLPSPNPTLPQNTLTVGPYAVTFPTGGSCGVVYAGQGYTINMVGVFGSSVQTTVAAG